MCKQNLKNLKYIISVKYLQYGIMYASTCLKLLHQKIYHNFAEIRHRLDNLKVDLQEMECVSNQHIRYFINFLKV